jgi:hypothetical protein
VSGRSAILDAIRRAAVPHVARAELPRATSLVEDLTGRFLQVVSHVGGRGVRRAPATPLQSLLDTEFPEGHGDVVVVRGRFGVAENGAVYVDADDLVERKQVVSYERLVLLVPESAIVATMHEAVRLMPRESRCGWFLSGPSKTADIEQSLVIGAQGARTLLVVLDPG